LQSGTPHSTSECFFTLGKQTPRTGIRVVKVIYLKM